MRLWILTIALVLAAGEARAHHILGIPHYAYDEQYPQTPVLTYLLEAGPYDVKMTGYPGRPEPGERSSLHIYIYRRDNGALYDKTVTVEVMQDALIGEDPTQIDHGREQGDRALTLLGGELELGEDQIQRLPGPDLSRRPDDGFGASDRRRPGPGQVRVALGGRLG